MLFGDSSNGANNVATTEFSDGHSTLESAWDADGHNDVVVPLGC